MAFVQDTFTDTSGLQLTSHTGEVGATWTYHGAGANTLRISNANRLRENASGESIAYASGTGTTAEYDIEADFRVVTNTGYAFLLARMSTGSTVTWYAFGYNASAGEWRIEKAVAGSFTSLGTFSQALSTATTYAIKAEIRNASKKLYVAGVERISSADNDITQIGRVGIDMFDSSDATGYHFDNLVATDAGGGGAAGHPAVKRMGGVQFGHGGYQPATGRMVW